MKKLFLLLFIFTAFSVYAESSLIEEVQVSEEYGYNNTDCRYSGKAKFSIDNSGIMYNSNICAKKYKANTDSIEKAYTEFVNMKNDLEIVKVLPAKIPLKNSKYNNKDKIIEFNIQENSLLVTVTLDNIDYNISFQKKGDKVYIYDFIWFYRFYDYVNPETTKTVDKVHDKLIVVGIYGMYEGSNLIHTASGVTVRNVYSDGDYVSHVKYIVNTQRMDEAYEIIRDYECQISELYAIAPDIAEQDYPKTLDENEGTERISNDFVKTKLLIGVVDESTVYLLREGSKIIGYAAIAEP